MKRIKISDQQKRIIDILKDIKTTPTDIARIIGTTPQSVSSQLYHLKRKDLVESYSVGSFSIYSLTPSALKHFFPHLFIKTLDLDDFLGRFQLEIHTLVKAYASARESFCDDPENFACDMSTLLTDKLRKKLKE